MAESFKPGDLVKLKSGGPTMTVEQTGNDSFDQPAVWCVWFDEKNTRQTATFAPETLARY